MKPLIAVTMGDPAGVGPELCVRLLANSEIGRFCTPVVFGDNEVLRRAATTIGLPLSAQAIPREEWQAGYRDLQSPAIVNLRELNIDSFRPGVSNAATGAASFLYVNTAIDAALAGEVVAVATGPLSKEALHAAGHFYPGHTEIFASRSNAVRSCMMQYSDEITCSFVTTHVGYRDVPQLLTADRIRDVIELTDDALTRIRGRRPTIVVCGLNPHAGEHGLFGDREEERIIVPAIESARQQGLNVIGPLPGDTAFIAERRRTTDAFICMYHDQGHIPVKALAFDTAVNTTLGLPIVRTSVDHGTALDIAWQGTARPDSLYSAVRLAVRLASNRMA
jgi:4-hydroxythreonine-4-phosphate dehydrogenase